MTRRLLAFGAILAAGVVSLPLAALPFDDSGENWILPIALGGTAAVGAGVSLAVPELVGERAGTARRALVGAAIGVGCSLIGTLVFWFLISGLRGA